MRANAGAFVQEWEGETREDAERQNLLERFEIFGIRQRRQVTFEQNVKKLSGTTGQIDAFWPGMLLVEHKSAGGDLTSAPRRLAGVGVQVTSSAIHQARPDDPPPPRRHPRRDPPRTLKRAPRRPQQPHPTDQAIAASASTPPTRSSPSSTCAAPASPSTCRDEPSPTNRPEHLKVHAKPGGCTHDQAAIVVCAPLDAPGLGTAWVCVALHHAKAPSSRPTEPSVAEVQTGTVPCHHHVHLMFCISIAVRLHPQVYVRIKAGRNINRGFAIVSVERTLPRRRASS